MNVAPSPAWERARRFAYLHARSAELSLVASPRHVCEGADFFPELRVFLLVVSYGPQEVGVLCLELVPSHVFYSAHLAAHHSAS